MSVQRFTAHSMRRLAAQQPGAFSRTAVSKIAAPAAIATSHHRVQTRHAGTQSPNPADAYQILVAQRRNRPVSPHLSIYQPQITWYTSVLTRITGSILSGGFYIFGAAYLVAPLMGWHLESASLAAAFGAWPVAAKVATKFAVALPFTYHSLNGVRHLAWDTGRNLSNLAVQRSGWAVVGASVVSAVWLAYM
ncbi:hypothetical protein MMC08_004963 [Hypocenomyce scalaris]|nr:hypothetical protein [Hypocenomyce scalaris]